MNDKLLEIKRGDCISLFINDSYESVYAITKLVRDINSNETIIFNSNQFYYPCKRVVMNYGCNLKDTIKEYINDFSIAIINCLYTNSNTKETMDFIRFIREDRIMKGKTFILVFYSNNEIYKEGDKLDYSYFEIYKKLIYKYCNKHYSFYPSRSNYTDEQWTCENLKTKTKKKYRQKNWKTDEIRLIDNDEYML